MGERTATYRESLTDIVACLHAHKTCGTFFGISKNTVRIAVSVYVFIAIMK